MIMSELLKALTNAVRNDPGDYRARLFRAMLCEGTRAGAEDLAWIANYAGERPVGAFARFMLQNFSDVVESGLEELPSHEKALLMEEELCIKLPTSVWMLEDISSAMKQALSLSVPGRWIAADSLFKCVGPRHHLDVRISMLEEILDNNPPESMVHRLKKNLAVLHRSNGSEGLDRALELERSVYDGDFSELFRIIEAMERENHDKAAQNIDALCDAFPEDEALIFRAGLLLYEKGEGYRAFKRFKDVRELGGSRKNDAAFYLGVIRAKDGDIHSALEYWSKLENENGAGFLESARESVLKAARALEKRSRLDEALTIYDEAASSIPEWERRFKLEAARLLMIIAHRKTSKDKALEAHKRFEDIINKWPESDEASAAKAEISYFNEDDFIPAFSLSTKHGRILILITVIFMMFGSMLFSIMPWVIIFAFGLAVVLVGIVAVSSHYGSSWLADLFGRFFT